MRVLVDTNILVRSVERRHPLMRVARQALRSLIQQENELCIAPQNIAEFWNVCTRPAEVNGLGNSVAATDRLATRIETFFTLLPDSIETFQRWRQIIVANEVKGAKVHDARLVAIMQTYGLHQLLTFNAVDFKRYAGIKVIDPAEAAT